MILTKYFRGVGRGTGANKLDFGSDPQILSWILRPRLLLLPNNVITIRIREFKK